MSRKPKSSAASEKRLPQKTSVGRSANEQELASRALTVNVYGEFPSTVTLIPYTQMTLLAGIGRVVDEETEQETHSILIPYVEMMLGGPEKEEGERETLLSKVIAFENMAFMIADMLSDFRRIAENLSDMAVGNLHPDPSRIELCRKYIETVKSSADEIVVALDKTIQSSKSLQLPDLRK